MEVGLTGRAGVAAVSIVALRIGHKVFVTLLTVLAVSFVVFLVMELSVDNVAVKVLGAYSTAEQRELWLLENGYRRHWLVRYTDWLGRFLVGDWGDSTRFRRSVFPLVMERLANTAMIAGLAIALVVPSAIIIGTIAGMRSGTAIDRGLSGFAIVSTSLPEFATAVFLSSVFVYQLQWLPGTSTLSDGWSLQELVMPALVLWLYSMGYLMRITRASVIQVMGSNYLRAAILKGVTPLRLIVHHILRNALVAPVTVIFLMFPYMLSGIIVVEVFFAYKGFGSLLLEAALNDDLFVVEACAVVAVAFVVASQLLSDLCCSLLNPRASFQKIR